MRKYIFTLLLLVSVFSWADVKVTISDGIYESSVKTKMETNMSALLSEINEAEASGRALNFSNLNLSKSVQTSLSMLWENSPFTCTDEEIVERCLTTGSGYQVRNIPLMMKPRADRNFGESEYQEAVINFDRQGNIESFYLSISMNLYMNVIKNNKEITDLRRRQLILDYVEQFRTSYNTKDIHFFEQVFSDDGTIVNQKQTKQEYLSNCRRVFANNSYIKVMFDDIKVMRHPVNPNFYGVTLHQGYTSSNYHDDGYLFLLWDFTNEDHPQIHVRTWQPDQLNGDRIPDDEIFNLNDFDI